jgi:hypothetical protein
MVPDAGEGAGGLSKLGATAATGVAGMVIADGGTESGRGGMPGRALVAGRDGEGGEGLMVSECSYGRCARDLPAGCNFPCARATVLTW